MDSRFSMKSPTKLDQELVRRSASRRELSQNLAWNRREFLRTAAGVTLGASISPAGSVFRAPAFAKDKKVVVITFGGGARDQETFAPEGQENIPHLMRELIPQASFFTQVVNKGILGHYVATASLATGVYETFNNFAATPPESPTVFEYFRKDLKRPASDAWVVAPSNGFNRIGESSHRLYGPGLGARVILPKPHPALCPVANVAAADEVDEARQRAEGLPPCYTREGVPYYTPGDAPCA